MAKITTIGSGVWVHERVSFGSSVKVGHASCIGYGEDDAKTVIGNGVSIGAFCLISLGVTIHDDVELDHYCRVSAGSIIGRNTKLLYGVQIFDDVRIGENCIVGGDVADRTVLEDEVTFLGEIVHSHRNANLGWDTTLEPSPVIRRGSFVGVNALIIGGVIIGPQSYIGAGEIVRTDIPPRTVLYKEELSSLDDWRGIIKVRG